MAFTTGSKFNNGSPIPIITTFVICLELGSLGKPKELAATQTCPIISSKSKFLEKPCFPVAQKLQSTAHPTCDETHKVALFYSGMRTISIKSFSPTLMTHFLVPSFDDFSYKISGTFISQVSSSL